MTLSVIRRLPILGALAAGLALGTAATIGTQALVALPETRHLAPGEQITIIADFPASPSQSSSPSSPPTPSPTQSPTPSPSPTPTALACPASLQAAVDAAPSGSTITLGSCFFRETVTVSKPLTLSGPATITGDGTRAHVLVVTSSDVTVDGLTITSGKPASQDGELRVTGASRFTLRNARVMNSAAAGLYVSGGSGHLITGSELAGNAQEGFALPGLSDSTISGNSIHGNNPNGAFSTGFEAGGGKATHLNRVVFDGNEVYGNVGAGLWCDISCQNVTYKNNRVHDNTVAGIFYEISTTGRITGNALWRNGRASSGYGWGASVLVASSGHVEVDHNTVAWSADGVSIIDQPTRTDRIADHGTSVSVHDNVVVMGAPAVGDPLACGLCWLQDSPGSMFTDSNSGSLNAYWWPTAESGLARFAWGNSGVSTLSTFNATAGEEGGTYLTTAQRDAALTVAGVPLAP